jgi:AmmeMemoRadiSam system protein B
MNTTIRHAAVAGAFYPDNAEELGQMVDRFLQQANSQGKPPKAIIAPHAGYLYSGAVAGNAYHLLEQVRDKIKKVVLLGPSHRVFFEGLALSSADYFETPLGQVPLDQEARDILKGFPQVTINDNPHLLEHSLEVHIPFLQRVLGDFTLVPLVVGDATAREVAEVLQAVWGDEETLIVISSDLSHYQDYDSARRHDSETSRHIEALEYEDLRFEDACGRIPVSGLLCLARNKGYKVHNIDLRNSGDTAGPRDQVVGYGAYTLQEN